MNSEELRIYLRTVADTAGAKQTQQALAGVQRQAAQSGGGLNITAAGAAKAAGAFVGMQQALQYASEGVQRFVGFVADSPAAFVESERVMRAVTASYGKQANEWVRFADQMSTASGVSRDAVLQSAVAARSLQANFRLSVEQARKLISLAGDLSQIRGIDLEAAFGRIESAMRGEAEASEYLGVTLGDVFMKTTAANGAFKNTWETMSEAAKAQARYNELLRQTQNFEGLAAQAADTLQGAQARSNVATEKLSRTLGGMLAPALKESTNLTTELTNAITRYLESLQPKAAAAPGEQLAIGAKEGQSSIDALSDSMRRLRIETRAQQQQSARRLGQLNEELAVQPRNEAQLAYFDQYDAAVRDLAGLLQRQVDLQRESIALSAEEARVKMSLLPAQERMAALQRDITEQQVRARLSALPATEALEDLRYEQERARLISQNRQVAAAERIDARRTLRDIAKRAPGVELRALEAQRTLVPSARAGERVGLQAQLLGVAEGRALAGIGAGLQANQFAQAITAALVPAQQQALTEIVADGMAKGFERMEPRTIEVHLHDVSGSETIFRQLIEAGQQAQGPTVVQQSGVRRS